MITYSNILVCGDFLTIYPGAAYGDFYNEPTQLRIKYKIGKVIGEGNFAIVKECTEK